MMQLAAEHAAKSYCCKLQLHSAMQGAAAWPSMVFGGRGPFMLLASIVVSPYGSGGCCSICRSLGHEPESSARSGDAYIPR